MSNWGYDSAPDQPSPSELSLDRQEEREAKRYGRPCRCGFCLVCQMNDQWDKQYADPPF